MTAAAGGGGRFARGRDPLARLGALRLEFGAAPARAKAECLSALARTPLRSAARVARLHELLCFVRAYPDDMAALAQAEAMLERFAARPDLRRFREALADSGIAGTALHYRFFYGQALWLAERWPAQLELDRRHAEAEQRIAEALPLLVTPVEAQMLIEAKRPGYAALDLVRGRGTGDAAFLLRRIAAVPGNGFARERLSDSIDAAFVLQPGAGTPSRSAEKLRWAPVAFQRAAPARERPDLREQLQRPPRRVRPLPLRRSEEIVEMARGAMVLRHRSLEAFSFADACDGWLVDDGQGLAFAWVGVVPERRQAVAAVYGGLTLRNGVPIGYLEADIVGRSAALSFNTFDTYRGGEAAFVFARMLASLRHGFGCTSFTLDPYQLGRGNDEGLESGAWWFYSKLGFVPRDDATRWLAAAELERMKRSAKHRTSPATLRRLADRHLFFDLDAQRPHPLPPLIELGRRCSDLLDLHGGADREAALDRLGRIALERCGVETLRGWRANEREAWRRFAPIVVAMDLGGWSAAERALLVDVVRAKGGRSERHYLERYQAHPRLDAALHAAAGQRSSRLRQAV